MVQLGTVGLPITAVVVALVNLSLPFVVKLFVIYVEVHKSLTSEQRSMMLKLVLARMVNSAFLLYISTEWPTSFTETALGQVCCCCHCVVVYYMLSACKQDVTTTSRHTTTVLPSLESIFGR